MPPEIKPENAPQIYGYLEDLLNLFANWLSSAIATVLNYFISLFSDFSLAFQSLINSVVGALDDAMAQLVSTVRAWITTIETFFSNLMAKIEGIVNQLFTALYNATVAVIDKVSTFVTNITNSVKAFVTAVTTEVVNFVKVAVDQVKAFATAALQALGAALGQVVDAIVNPIAVTLAKLEQAVIANENAILAEWVNLVSGAENLLSTTTARLANLAEALRDVMTDLQETVTSKVDTISAEVGAKVDELIKYIFGEASNDTISHLFGVGDRLVTGQMRVDEFRGLLRSLIDVATPTTGIGRVLATGLMFALIALPGYASIGQAYSNILLQELGLVLPFNVLSPGDAAAAYRRRQISFGEATEAIRRGGWTSQDAERMIVNTEQVPPPGDVMAAMLRDLISPEEADDALFQQGLTARWRGVVKDLSQLIPPVQDLITMAVREAFSPEIAESFGQYEDFPDQFAFWAKKQGLSETWATRYWAAHWSLPSPMQGFEMLHRGVINFEQLRLLLRALDVMPFWRDKLTEIAYLPFTRVDIRRMHALKVLNEAAVMRAHLDLGYNEEKAKLLTAFVVKLNAGSGIEDDAELGKLSRATILGFYKDGLLDRQRAGEMLVTVGHTHEAAELYLEATDMDAERELRTIEIALIVDNFKAGVLTYDEAIDSLNGMGLATAEVGKAVQQLTRAQRSAVKLPSKEDGGNFYEAGLISEADYRDLLSRLGYARKWVDAYVALLDKEKANANQPSGA